MRPTPLLLAVAALFLHPASPARASDDELKDHLLVVYNRNFEDSENLARYYAAQRGIPEERVFGISCPNEEEITRPVYNDTIRDPINRYLVTKDWILRQKSVISVQDRPFTIEVGVRNDIWAIVLMRGIPLKIAPDATLNEPAPSNPALAVNNAAVDSELATLPILGMPVNGVQINPYYDSGYARNFDSLDARYSILVTRLDAPTAADVRRMIDDSLYAEEFRLTGRAYIDARGLTDANPGYQEGDLWLRADYDRLLKFGWPVEFDNKPDVYPESLPWSDVALYLGWYTEQATGPFMRQDRAFVPGAIACHIHSFSATTVRDARKYWVGPLLSHGAAATMGAVYEPYLDLTPHLDVFVDRLLQGYSFAEAAYASQRALSWMITVVGDPLYRPFRISIDTAIERDTKLGIPQREWLVLQKVRSSLENATVHPNREDIAVLAADPKASHITWEGYGDLLCRPDQGGDFKTAATAYDQAWQLATKPMDRVRIGLKLASADAGAGQWKDSYAAYERLFQTLPAEARSNGVPQALKQTSSMRDAPPLPASLLRELPK